MKIIFSPSAPQSGTWFVLRLFEKLGCRIEHAGEIIRDKKAVNVGDVPIILHTHIFPFYFNPEPYKYSWPSFGGDPIQEYVVRKNNLAITGIRLLCSLYKTIIPIRDPLACLLTRENRAPNLRHFYIVDAFVEIAKLENHPNVAFLPVDLKLTVQERKELLIDRISHCGFSYEDNKEVIDAVSEEWKKENVTPNNRFHELYNSKDIESIKNLLGEKCAEITHLKNMSGIIMPFLSRLGYDDLIW